MIYTWPFKKKMLELYRKLYDKTEEEKEEGDKEAVNKKMKWKHDTISVELDIALMLTE